MQPEAAQNREYEQSQFDLLCRGEEMTEVTGAYESPILEPGPAGMSPAVEIQWGAFLRSEETRVCDAGHSGVVTNNVPLERPFEKEPPPVGAKPITACGRQPIFLSSYWVAAGMCAPAGGCRSKHLAAVKRCPGEAPGTKAGWSRCRKFSMRLRKDPPATGSAG